jgi:hypothetical protein
MSHLSESHVTPVCQVLIQEITLFPTDGMIERQVENREVFRLLEEAVAREKEAGVNGEPEIKRASKKVVRLYRGGCELGQPLGEESRISSVSQGLPEVEGRIYGGPRATR